MATIKSYTDIEQSKALAEILPHESADFCWGIDDETLHYNNSPYPCAWKNYSCKEYYIPCWSLAALLNYLKSKNKFPEIKELSDGCFKLATYIWDGKDCIQVSIGDSIVDACVAMIEKLNELNLL